MQKAADKILEVLKEKLACYQQLNLVLKAEKKAIAAIDLGMVWDTTRAKKELAEKIQGLRDELVSICQNHFSKMDVQLEPFSLRALVYALPMPDKDKEDIRQIRRAMDKEKDMAAHFTKYNRLQVKKNLSVMDDIMAVIGSNASLAQYTGRGMVARGKKDNCLFKIAG